MVTFLKIGMKQKLP